ncbi:MULTISPECIES: AEC family transporter [Vagococcus]|uniref:Malate permease n=1 Tax=Vagococcus fluvialis bH819 TaxID=1255619 RepID=A0A1X6WP47_9ENTE|nr:MULTISPECIES: AEC family transporter [Vagococcus]SLM86084.1 Malate permease [Vagococcus fluvialis bH819]HCM90333.1 hypothetical protein [Vagococcus sp.]
MFLLILEQNVMLFVYLSVGYYLAKIGKISEQGLKEAGFFLSNFALTCAIFNSFQTPYTDEKFRLIKDSLLVALILIIFLILLSFILTRLFKIDSEKKETWRACCIFSNILFIGIPIVDSLYGEVGLIVLVSFNTIFNLFLFSIGESIFSGTLIVSVKKVLRTPAILSMALGMLLFVLDIRLPIFLGTPIQVLASFTAPLAMIVNGAMFYGTSIKKLIKNKEIILFCLVRLILIPILAMLIFRPFISNEMVFALLVLVAAMPSGSLNSVFAEMYQGKGQLASNYIILSTLVSLITVPLMITLSQIL